VVCTGPDCDGVGSVTRPWCVQVSPDCGGVRSVTRPLCVHVSLDCDDLDSVTRPWCVQVRIVTVLGLLLDRGVYESRL
jgi:hypothetical protein